MIRIIFSALLTLAPISAHAFDRINDEGAFLALIAAKSLTNRLYGITLRVTPEGVIAGDALGWDVSGAWRWDDGHFCREMAWGGDPIPYNCQLVEASGNELRFTSDQGSGASASFKLR